MPAPQPLDIKKFSGGLADEGLSVTPQHYTRADNLLLTPQYDLVTRPGSVLFDSAHAQLPSGQNRVNGLINYDQDTNLLAISGAHAYVYTGGNWSEITGAAGDALHTGTYAASLSTAEWKKHIFIASSEQITPLKIFKNGAGSFQVITAGLPTMATPVNYVSATALASAITLANAIRTKVLLHFASTAIHKSADTVSVGLVPAVATDLATLITLTTGLLHGYQNHYNDYQGASIFHVPETWTVQTTAADQLLSSLQPPTTLEEIVPLLDDLKAKYNAHDGKVDIHLYHYGSPSSFKVTSALLYGVTSGPHADLNFSYFYALANAIKAMLLAHFNDYSGTPSQTTNAHSALDATEYNGLIAIADATTPETLETLVFKICYYYGWHDFDASPAGSQTFHSHVQVADHSLSFNPYGALGPALTELTNFDGTMGLTAGNWTKMVTRLNEILTKTVAHINEASDVVGASMHMAGSVHYLAQFGAGSKFIADYTMGGLGQIQLGSYVYAFTYEYPYTIGTTTFTMESPPLLVQAQHVIKPETAGLLIQGIVALANSGSSNYDVSNVKINIYRTVDGGQTLFYVDQISNGTTTYTDYTTDVILAQARQIYTAGGVSDNDPAPSAKYVHIVDDFGYWGSTPEFPNRVFQSIAGSPDAVPGDYFVDLPYPNTGVSSVKGVRVAWTKKKTYRLEGTIDEQGRGSIVAIAISDSVGCVGGFGVVPTDDGIVFPGSDGFYITNGYQVSKLSRDWRTTYLNIIRTDSVANLIYGTLDKKKQRVWFSTSSTGTENDSMYVLDLSLNLGENASWTSASNTTHFAPSSLCVFNDQIIRGDSRGYVFKHDDTYTSDPKVNTAISGSLWNTRAIFPDYRSSDLDFGTIMMRKWVPKIVVKAKNRGNMSLQINSVNDAGANIAALTPIRYRGNTDSGDPTILSVGGGPTLSNGGLPEYKRHFPSGSLRCSTKQVQLILAKVDITNSDTIASGTLVQGTGVLTVAGATFPDYVDHVLALANDGYVREYTITANTGTTLTVSDPGSHLPANGTYKWVVRGYPKDEKWQITNYLLYYNILGTVTDGAQSTGENA